MKQTFPHNRLKVERPCFSNLEIAAHITEDRLWHTLAHSDCSLVFVLAACARPTALHMQEEAREKTRA